MSKGYYITQHMATGNGFRCYNCGQELMKRLTGSVYEITLDCRRCKCEITVRTREPIPFVEQNVKGAEE